MLNPSPFKVTLYAGETVGSMEPLEQYGVHVLEAEAPSHDEVPNRHIPDQRAPGRRSPELEAAFQSLESQAEGLIMPELQELHQLLVSFSDIISTRDGDIGTNKQMTTFSQKQSNDPDINHVIQRLKDGNIPDTLPKTTCCWIKSLWCQRNYLVLHKKESSLEDGKMSQEEGRRKSYS